LGVIIQALFVREKKNPLSIIGNSTEKRRCMDYIEKTKMLRKTYIKNCKEIEETCHGK
jgi:hypothetical protein